MTGTLLLNTNDAMKKLNPCTWIRQARYPKTENGRRRYLQDSLSGNVTPFWIEAIICLILSPLIIPLMIYAGFKWLYLKITGHKN